MFAEELADLKDRYPERLHLVHVLSREPQESALLSGRLDADRLARHPRHGWSPASTVDEWFLCGPYGMVLDAKRVLAERGVPDAAVHTELFHVDEVPAPPRAAADRTRPTAPTVTILLDGRASTLRDGAATSGCWTRRCGCGRSCRTRARAGSARPAGPGWSRARSTMARNFALEPDEVAAGYVLTCQSSPVTDTLVVDYDA